MEHSNTNTLSSLTHKAPMTILVLAVIAITYVMIKVSMPMAFVLALTPFAILIVGGILYSPYISFMLLFMINYAMVPLIRYADVDGLSVIMDILIYATFASILLSAAVIKPRNHSFSIFNDLLAVTFIWTAYCALELLNPTAMTSAWFTARALSTYMFLMILLTFLVFRDFRQIEQILVVLSVLTLLGVAKALMQKYYGFDWAEQRLLDAGMHRTHLLMSGTRYFSFFASAGIFGAVMGSAMTTFGIVAVYAKNNLQRIYYIFVALVALYGLLISGTRGALAVPAAGFMLFALLSKQIKIAIPSIMVMVSLYIFLAFTTIGQSNATIRRVRTIFNPNEPSLMVRLNNQKILGQYLKDRPFGEGLGLSGVEAQPISHRFTTSIPTDSWYVKIWVETGIVGLCLYLSILAYIFIRCSYIILFKIKDNYIRGVMTAFLGSALGIAASSYGNLVFNQFPVGLITYMSIALVFMGPYFDKRAESAKLTN